MYALIRQLLYKTYIVGTNLHLIVFMNAGLWTVFKSVTFPAFVCMVLVGLDVAVSGILLAENQVIYLARAMLANLVITSTYLFTIGTVDLNCLVACLYSKCSTIAYTGFYYWIFGRHRMPSDFFYSIEWHAYKHNVWFMRGQHSMMCDHWHSLNE